MIRRPPRSTQSRSSAASDEYKRQETYTPVNGLLPSVFVHAMALDNLITYQGKPKQNVITVWGRTLKSNPAKIIAIMPVILVLSLLHIRRLRAREIHRSGHGRGVTMEYVCLL